jgi:hypothetical protein
MADPVKIQGRLYPSFQEDALRELDPPRTNAAFGVMYINGDKTKLFHFLWSTSVVLSFTKVSDSDLREYYEVNFNPDASFFFLDKNGVWNDAQFKDYQQEQGVKDSDLIFDASVTHGTRYALVGRPTYELLRLNKWFLSEED